MAEPSPLKRVVAAAIMAAGALVALLSGLCSAAFLLAMVASSTQGSMGLAGLLGVLSLVAMVGGVPFFAGLGLIYFGWTIWNGR